MSGSTTAIRQERMKKTGARPTTPALFTINEEDELQKNGLPGKAKVDPARHGMKDQLKVPLVMRGMWALKPSLKESSVDRSTVGGTKSLSIMQAGKPHPCPEYKTFVHDDVSVMSLDIFTKAPDGFNANVQEKKVAICHPMPAGQGQLVKDHPGYKSEPHLTMKVDERQRLARERREEREKLMAARESLWLEKEARARQHYEKQLEERKKKLEEQRVKEEKRRAAVDEKRKMKLEEEKERHEAVVRRTIERSQKPKQKNNRWSWGGPIQSNPSVSSSDPDRRSVSTMNLSKHIDPVINKRLSTSSATLLNSPDRGRRPPLSPWESSVVNRLLMPTHSYLARSKSIAALSGDAVIPICPRSASCSPIIPQPYKIAKGSERPKVFFTTPEAISRRKTTHFAGHTSTERENVTPTPIIKRANSPIIPKMKSPALFPVGHPQKSPAPTSVLKSAVASNTPIKAVTNPQRPPSPGNVRPIKKDDSKRKSDMKAPNEARNESLASTELAPVYGVNTTEKRLPPLGQATPDTVPVLPSTPVIASPTQTGKPFAGTNNPEEATRILAEKRRLAREQRERDEQEKQEKEEEERKKKEELAKRKTEERARQEEEARNQVAEQKQREEEERQEKERMQLQLAQEKEQKDKEEVERLQRQKEEDERIRIEREKHFQKEEQERSERKKRLDEIMKRTRRSEAGDKQPNVQRNGELPISTENTAVPPSSLQQEQESVFLNSPTENSHNGEIVRSPPRIITYPVDSTEKQPNENGLFTSNNNFEEIITLPVGTKTIKLDSLNNEGNSIQEIPLNPKLAFEEQITIVPLPQVDNVQTPQTTDQGMHFTSEIVQEAAQALVFTYHPHSAMKLAKKGQKSYL
ncbi:ensconsin [Pelodytes ibericus]